MAQRGWRHRADLFLTARFTLESFYLFILYSIWRGSPLMKKKFQVNKICNRRWILGWFIRQFPVEAPRVGGTRRLPHPAQFSSHINPWGAASRPGWAPEPPAPPGPCCSFHRSSSAHRRCPRPPDCCSVTTSPLPSCLSIL